VLSPVDGAHLASFVGGVTGPIVADDLRVWEAGRLHRQPQGATDKAEADYGDTFAFSVFFRHGVSLARGAEREKRR
jgi:hypothetical protein